MSRPKKETPVILTPEQLQAALDAYHDDWKEVLDLYREARISGDTDRAADLHMIACAMAQSTKNFHREQQELALLRRRAQGVHVRRRIA